MIFFAFEDSAKSLYALLKEHIQIQTDKMVHTFYEIADALNTIHISGYLHNDLKLDNVVVYGNRDFINPVIIDFGRSCKIGKGRFFNLTAVEREKYRESRRHVAPELVDGRGCQSILSDIFSFGYMAMQVIKCGYSSKKLDSIVKLNCVLIGSCVHL